MLPSFDNCINYDSISGSDAVTTCGSLCDGDDTCQFFALYNTLVSMYCGLWSTSFNLSDITQAQDYNQQSVQSAFGYNQDGTASGSSTPSTSDDSPSETASSDETSSSIDVDTIDEPSSTTSIEAKGSSYSTDITSTTTQITGETASVTISKTASTMLPTSSSIGAVSSPLPGFYMKYTGLAAIPPDENCINYFLDINYGMTAVNACYKACLDDQTCQFFTTWMPDSAHTAGSSNVLCALYDKKMEVSDATVTKDPNGDLVEHAVGWNRGSSNPLPIPSTFKTSSKCGYSGYQLIPNLPLIASWQQMATVQECKRGCLSKAGCNSYSFSPNIGRCQLYSWSVNSTVVAESPLSPLYW